MLNGLSFGMSMCICVWIMSGDMFVYVGFTYIRRCLYTHMFPCVEARVMRQGLPVEWQLASFTSLVSWGTPWLHIPSSWIQIHFYILYMACGLPKEHSPHTLSIFTTAHIANWSAWLRHVLFCCIKEITLAWPDTVAIL